MCNPAHICITNDGVEENQRRVTERRANCFRSSRGLGCPVLGLQEAIRLRVSAASCVFLDIQELTACTAGRSIPASSVLLPDIPD